MAFSVFIAFWPSFSKGVSSFTSSSTYFPPLPAGFAGGFLPAAPFLFLSSVSKSPSKILTAN